MSLAENRLEFRGFVDVPVEALRSVDPGAGFPGDLAAWANWETRHPRAFAGMYQFWCAGP